jgi:hypothetical protein
MIMWPRTRSQKRRADKRKTFYLERAMPSGFALFFANLAVDKIMPAGNRLRSFCLKFHRRSCIA